MKLFRPLPVSALLLVIALALLAVREASWRYDYRLAGADAAPDGAWVAEVRSLPQTLQLGSGVFLRGRWQLVRSFHPRLVFVGSCDQLSTRWFGQRRLVITCQVRSGEPVLLQDLVNDVRIELVVDRNFG